MSSWGCKNTYFCPNRWVFWLFVVLLWYLDTPSIPCLTCLCRWNFHSYKRISYSYKHVAEAHIFLHTRRRFLQRISYFLQTRCWILHADYRCLAVNTNSSLLTVVFAATQPPSLSPPKRLRNPPPPPKRGRNIFQEVEVEHFSHNSENAFFPLILYIFFYPW